MSTQAVTITFLKDGQIFDEKEKGCCYKANGKIFHSPILNVFGYMSVTTCYIANLSDFARNLGAFRTLSIALQSRASTSSSVNVKLGLFSFFQNLELKYYIKYIKIFVICKSEKRHMCTEICFMYFCKTKPFNTYIQNTCTNVFVIVITMLKMYILNG